MSRARPKIFLWILILILCSAGGVSSVLADDGEGSNSLSIQGSSSVPENTQSQYTAYFGGSRVSASWSLSTGTRASSTLYASISSSGLLTARSLSSNQTVTVRASYSRNGTVYSAYKSVTITNTGTGTTVSLTGLTITGPGSVNSGASAIYTATATFSNNTTQNVTASATWTLSPVVGSITAGSYSPGQATSQTVTITASFASVSGTRLASIPVNVVAQAPTVTLSSVTVSGPASVTAGTSASYTATALFSNNTTQNVTSNATWSVAPVMGTISGGNYSPGQVSAQTVTISASYTSGGVSRSGSATVAITATTPPPTSSGTPQVLGGAYQVFAYNDLGMHCYDSDFSVAAVLPPYNVLRAQVILKGLTPQLMTGSQVNVSYEAVADGAKSINTTSAGKTNFWTYVLKLFGASLQVDQGIKSQWMPGTSNTRQPFASPYDTTMHWFGAEGIPITCYDDANKFNTEPLMRVSVRNSSGTVLSTLDTVVPASNEMNCANCHVTGGVAASSGLHGVTAWSTAPSTNKVVQVKENILILHDAINNTTLMANQPVLCASCHYSPALDLNHTGPTATQSTHKYLSRAMHQHHGLTVTGAVPDATHPAIVSGNTTSACYQCHPGANTQCLRGAMATAGETCESCHGGMLAVGGYYKLSNGTQRTPWVDEPKCQSCHTGDAVSHQGANIIGTQAYSSTDLACTPIVATNTRFAEPANTLYRFSTGHGGVACEACHGSTHAEWPTSSANDNVAATQIQGHSGTITECTACHGTGLSRTIGGPHGMHNVNDPNFWNGGHEGFLGTNGANCKTCHGTDGLGTVLSKTKANRTFGSRNIAAGTPIACNMCHSNKINGG